MSNICRLCLKNERDQQLEDIFNGNVAKIINLLTHIQILPEKGLPSKICQECRDKLNDFSKFRDKIENHEYLLKKCLAKLQTDTLENVERLSNNIHGHQFFISNNSDKSSDRDIEILNTSVNPYSITVYDNNLSLPLTNSVTINLVSDEQNLDILEKEVSKLLNCEQEIEEVQPVVQIPKGIFISEDSEDQEVGYNDITKYLKSSLSIDFDKLKEDMNNLKHFEKEVDPKRALEKLTSRGVTLVKMEQDVIPTVDDEISNESVEKTVVSVEFKTADKLVEVASSSKCSSDFITPIETRELFIDEDVLEEIVPRICETITTLIHVNDGNKTNQEELCTFNRYICHLCLKEFKTCDKAEFDRHSLGHFPENVTAKTQNCPPFTCEVCSGFFSHRIDLVVHQREHFNLKLFSCDTCVKCFISVSHLKVHKATCLIQDLPNKFMCIRCGLGFSKRRDLDSHEKTHDSKKYDCELCGKSMSTTLTLRNHMKRHTMGLTFECDKCQKRFYNRHDLERHVQHHTGVRKFPCSLCDKSFYSNAERRRHLLYHTKTRRFTCKICGKSFYESGHLQAHVHTHMENKPFMCEICSKDFTTKVKLKRHIKTSHKENPKNTDVIGEGVDSFIIVEESDDDADNNSTGDKNLQMFTDEAGQMFFILKSSENNLTLSPIM